MRDETFEKVVGRAALVCKTFALGEEAEALLKPELTGRQFLDLLVAGKLFVDAIRFVAHALPRREAVWWACRCVALSEEAMGKAAVKKADQEKLKAEVAARLAAERWVTTPNEDNRRAAYTAAEAAEFGTAGGCLALSAFFSGGSLAPPNVPVVAPAEKLTPQSAANAVLLAAVRTEPEKAAEKYRAFCALGVAVAEHENRCPEDKPASGAPPQPPPLSAGARSKPLAPPGIPRRS